MCRPSNFCSPALHSEWVKVALQACAQRTLFIGQLTYNARCAPLPIPHQQVCMCMQSSPSACSLLQATMRCILQRYVITHEPHLGTYFSTVSQKHPAVNKGKHSAIKSTLLSHVHTAFCFYNRLTNSRLSTIFWIVELAIIWLTW